MRTFVVALAILGMFATVVQAADDGPASSPIVGKLPDTSDNLSDSYCTCTTEQIADRRTYQQWGPNPDAFALADLKQKVEAAGQAFR